MTLTTTKPAEQARQLSSGTISTLLREDYFRYLKALQERRGRERSAFGINPLMSSRYYVIDRVQYAFVRYCELHKGSDKWESWQDAWRQWASDLRSVNWVLGYMGATEFQSPFFTGRAECKHRASKYEQSIYNGSAEEFREHVEAKVGCVYPYGGNCRELGEYLGCLFPMYAPMYFDKEDGYRPKIYEGWERPHVVHENDALVTLHRSETFDPGVDLWQDWKKQALKHGHECSL